VRDRELGIRVGMRKQRFVKQAEVTMYEDGYTEWPDHVQRKFFVKFGKRMSQPIQHRSMHQHCCNVTILLKIGRASCRERV